ncbi:hypothetical protein BH11BAC4_BH11BAC4_16710 [soil metagenome]
MQKVAAKQSQALIFLLFIVVVIIACLVGTGWYLLKSNIAGADKNAHTIATWSDTGRQIKKLI